MDYPGGVDDPETDGNGDAAEARAAHRELWEETGLRLSKEGLVRSEAPPDDPIAAPSVVCWTTPAWYPIRFRTRFFHVVVERADAPVPTEEDMEALRFEAPADLLAGWRDLRYLIAPPTRRMLEALVRLADPTDSRALAESLDDDDRSLAEEFEPMSGIQALPLRTPTLPPATHTNCYVLGGERLLVVDPATPHEEERERLATLLARIGRPLAAILLTHHHEDHVGAVQWLRARTGAPVWAHPVTAELLAGTIPVDRTLEEGDVIDLGQDRSGRSVAFDLVHTPGHAAGHLVLVDKRQSERPAMIVGDMVASVGTIIVDPDEGSMKTYVEQLARMRDMNPGVLFPAHGPPIFDGPAKLAEYLDHRAMREAKVIRALRSFEEATPADLLPTAYDDVPPKLWPLAERSLIAHLEKLVEEGRATRSPPSAHANAAFRWGA